MLLGALGDLYPEPATVKLGQGYANHELKHATKNAAQLSKSDNTKLAH